MELPAHTSAATPRELEQLAEEQALGKATNLGCPGFETRNTITTAVSSGPTEISGKTASSRGNQTSTNPAAIPRSSASTNPAATSSGKTAISRGSQDRKS